MSEPEANETAGEEPLAAEGSAENVQAATSVEASVSVAAAQVESTSVPRPIVSVRGLKKHYGETYAVRDLSFDVMPGHIFGFIGPNGAGKTTTLRVLATLLEPTAGSITVDGYCVEADTEIVRQLIGYMPDHFGVYDGNTVEEYLEFFAGAYGVPRARRLGTIRDVMALTDLIALGDRMVGSLSKGMKQRLCLAKTLIHDPKVLILDEPASALDPRARIEFRALLKELRTMGKTIIISSHILTELSDVCDAVAIIEKGELVDSGAIAHLQKKGQRGDRVRMQLLADANGVEEILGGEADVSSVRAVGKDVSFEYLGAPEEFHRLVERIASRGVPFLSIEYNPTDLEDLFLELTRGDVQ